MAILVSGVPMPNSEVTTAVIRMGSALMMGYAVDMSRYLYAYVRPWQYNRESDSVLHSISRNTLDDNSRILTGVQNITCSHSMQDTVHNTVYKGTDMWDFLAIVFQATCKVADEKIKINAMIDIV